MSRSLTALFFALSLLTCMYLVGRMQSVQAQRTSGIDNSAKQKFEYCAITSSGSMNENELAVGIATIVYFDSSSSREESVKILGNRVGKPTDGEYQRAQKRALDMTIAQLGSQGWEMVGQLLYGSFRSAEGEPTALFFKRAKD